MLFAKQIISSTIRTPARESLWRDSSTAGFTIFEAVLVVIIVFVIAATLIPKFGVVLGHARVNRAANVVAAELMLAQTLAGRQHAPVAIAIRSDSLFLRISNAATGAVLRTYYFDPTSDFHLAALSSAPTSIQVMPNGTATATMVVTIGATTDYYHQVTMTLAGQVRVTK